MNRWVRIIERIDRKYVIQIPIIMILILTTITFPSAQLVTAAGRDDILNVSDLTITNDSKNSIDKGGCWRFYNNNVGFYVPSNGKWFLKNNQLGITKWNGMRLNFQVACTCIDYLQGSTSKPVK